VHSAEVAKISRAIIDKVRIMKIILWMCFILTLDPINLVGLWGAHKISRVLLVIYLMLLMIAIAIKIAMIAVYPIPQVIVPMAIQVLLTSVGFIDTVLFLVSIRKVPSEQIMSCRRPL